MKKNETPEATYKIENSYRSEKDLNVDSYKLKKLIAGPYANDPDQKPVYSKKRNTSESNLLP